MKIRNPRLAGAVLASSVYLGVLAGCAQLGPVLGAVKGLVGDNQGVQANVDAQIGDRTGLDSSTTIEADDGAVVNADASKGKTEVAQVGKLVQQEMSPWAWAVLLLAWLMPTPLYGVARLVKHVYGMFRPTKDSIVPRRTPATRTPR